MFLGKRIIVLVHFILGRFPIKICPAWTTPETNPEPPKDVLFLAIPSHPPHAHSPLLGSKTSWTPLWFLIRNSFEIAPKALKTLDFLLMQSQRAHRTCVWAGDRIGGKIERTASESAQKKNPSSSMWTTWVLVLIWLWWSKIMGKKAQNFWNDDNYSHSQNET